MSVPNLKQTVEFVRASKPWDFTTASGLCAYASAVVAALHAVNPNFGHLVKNASQNHCVDSLGRRHGRDVTLYKSTGQVVDFIEKSDPSNNPGDHGVIWLVGPENEYPVSSWFAPVGTPPVDPTVPPDDLTPRVTALEMEVAANKLRMESINTRFDAESKENVTAHEAFVRKPLPDYIGTVRIFGFTFNIVSKPR